MVNNLLIIRTDRCDNGCPSDVVCPVKCSYLDTVCLKGVRAEPPTPHLCCHFTLDLISPQVVAALPLKSTGSEGPSGPYTMTLS